MPPPTSSTAAPKKGSRLLNRVKQQMQQGGSTKKNAQLKSKAKSAAAASRKQLSDSEDESGSSSEEEDGLPEPEDEIGLLAAPTVKATNKPITGDAKKSNPVAAAAASAPTKNKGKKRKADSDADEEDSEAPADPNELIDVEFGIYDPRPVDYLTLKMLLKDYIHPSAPSKKAKAKSTADDDEEMAAAGADDFALHELCDAIVDQVGVGSMVKGEGTEEPLGFCTVLNLAWQAKYGKNQDGQQVKWVDQFKKYVLKHAPASSKSAFETALRDPATGLLIQNRLINVPPQIVPQLHTSLSDDMDWIQKEIPGPGKYGETFKFKQYLLIAKQFKPAPGSKRQVTHDVLPSAQFISPFASKKKQKKNAQATPASSTSATLPEYEWLRFEEELYARAATAQYTFACPFTFEDQAAGRTQQNCVVMIVPHNKLQGIIQELQVMGAMA